MELFSRLLRLHSAPVPLEDFFTEVVAHLFGASPRTCLRWLEHTRLSESKQEQVHVSTQHSFDPLEHHVAGSRLDMLIELSDGRNSDVILIESKIGSREGAEQLRRYAELLDAMTGFRDKTLVYITRDFDPKNRDEILANTEGSSVNFVQLRWHDFYLFLKAQPKTMLIDEILLFMEERGMAQSSQFDAVDLLALSNMPKVLDLMDATMKGEVSARFDEVVDGRVRGATILDNIQQHSRYLLISYLNRDGSWWYGLGYRLRPSNVTYGLRSTTVTDYPTVWSVLEVSPKAARRHEIIGVMQEIEKHGDWVSWGLNDSKAWAQIMRERSLRDFLSSPDHVAEIKKFFIKSLDELQEIKEQYPHLPWDDSTR